MSLIRAARLRYLILVIGMAAVVGGLSTSPPTPAEASHTIVAYSKWTGYAMYGINGASGYQVYQGHVATHSPVYCSGDPASAWVYWTYITLDSPSYVPTRGYYGDTYNRTTFYMIDRGDAYCTQPNYWVDAYFGRFEPLGPRSYYCGGPGESYYGVPNNCNDALNWGYYYVWYRAYYTH